MRRLTLLFTARSSLALSACHGIRSRSGCEYRVMVRLNIKEERSLVGWHHLNPGSCWCWKRMLAVSGKIVALPKRCSRISGRMAIQELYGLSKYTRETHGSTWLRRTSRITIPHGIDQPICAVPACAIDWIPHSPTAKVVVLSPSNRIEEFILR